MWLALIWVPGTIYDYLRSPGITPDHRVRNGPWIPPSMLWKDKIKWIKINLRKESNSFKYTMSSQTSGSHSQKSQEMRILTREYQAKYVLHKSSCKLHYYKLHEPTAIQSCPSLVWAVRQIRRVSKYIARITIGPIFIEAGLWITSKAHVLHAWSARFNPQY